MSARYDRNTRPMSKGQKRRANRIMAQICERERQRDAAKG